MTLYFEKLYCFFLKVSIQEKSYLVFIELFESLSFDLLDGIYFTSRNMLSFVYLGVFLAYIDEPSKVYLSRASQFF